MKILFFGDSITDANRDRETDCGLRSYGVGFVRTIAGKLLFDEPTGYTIINRGVSGNRIVDLYARIKKDLWNETPDFLSILIGVNDIWHEIAHQNGVDLARFERIYRSIIEETQERLPNIKILLCEPFVLLGAATQDVYERFLELKEYAKIVKKTCGRIQFVFFAFARQIRRIFGKIRGYAIPVRRCAPVCCRRAVDSKRMACVI